MPELTPAEEEAILTRAGIRIVLGGHESMWPPHHRSQPRVEEGAWPRRSASARCLVAGSAEDWTELIATVAAMSSQHIELLVAYDEDGSLGGAEWIAAHATEREVWTGLKAVLDEAFPQIAELLRRCRRPSCIPTVLQLLESSTSSPSPAGPPSAAPKSSKPRSPRASSRS